MSVAEEEIAQLRQQLVDLRRAQGMTQRDVAEALELDQSTIANLERGRRTPGLLVLVDLLRLYRARLSVVVEGEDPALHSLDPTERELVLAARRVRALHPGREDLALRIARRLEGLDEAHVVTLRALVTAWEQVCSSAREEDRAEIGKTGTR